jgi:uncharacterized protein (UPF0218 family)
MPHIGPHLSLPETSREAMREPLGPVVLENDLVLHLKRSDTIITVGDVVTITIVDAGYHLSMALFDYKTLRDQERDFCQRLQVIEGERVRVHNPPATITAELWTAIKSAMLKVNAGGRVLMEVDGEEDLAALPAIMMAPDGAKVLYGMPGRGIVVVTIDKHRRKAAKRLLDLMEPKEGWNPV